MIDMKKDNGLHIRRVENGYVVHEYESDKDWVYGTIECVCEFLKGRDKAMSEVQS